MTTDLPLGWEWARVDELCEVTLGQSPPGSSYNDVGEGSPFLQGKAEFGATYPSIRKWTTQPKKHAAAGSVLVSVRAPVGPTNLAPVYCSIGRGLAALKPREPITSEFILWAMRASENRLLKQASGSTFDAITGAHLREHRIPVPPLAEQERIVAAIEEHFSRLDAVDASLQTAALRCQAIVKSILVGVIPSELPSCWRVTTVDEAGQTGLGRQRSPRYHNGPNMKPYLRVANVFEDRIDASDIMEMHFDAHEFDKYRLEVGDVLLNEGQSPEFLGRPAIYRGDPRNIAFTNSLIRFVPGPDVTSEWALLVFRRHMHSGRFMKESRITTNIAHLALGRFRSVEFPIPPLEVQAALVAATRTALDSVDRATEQIRSAANKTAAHRSAVLIQAFAGQLVRQNLHDDPAADFVDRAYVS